jgi:hypothetical protein
MDTNNDTSDRATLPSLDSSGSTRSSLRRWGGRPSRPTRLAAPQAPEEEPSVQTFAPTMLFLDNSSVSQHISGANTQATNPSNLITADTTGFSRDLPSRPGFTGSAGTRTSFEPWGLSARDEKPRGAFLGLFHRLLLYLRQQPASRVTLGIVSSDYEPILSNLRAIV